MATIEIKSGVKVQEFSRKRDGKKLSISINVGDPEALKAWIARSKELESISKNITTESAIDTLMTIEREIISMALGKKWWKKIVSFCDNNIFAVMDIVVSISTIMKDGVEENVRK